MGNSRKSQQKKKAEVMDLVGRFLFWFLGFLLFLLIPDHSTAGLSLHFPSFNTTMPTQGKPRLQWMGKRKSFPGRFNLHLQLKCYFQVPILSSNSRIALMFTKPQELRRLKQLWIKFQPLPYAKPNIYNKKEDY